MAAAVGRCASNVCTLALMTTRSAAGVCPSVIVGSVVITKHSINAALSQDFIGALVFLFLRELGESRHALRRACVRQHFDGQHSMRQRAVIDTVRPGTVERIVGRFRDLKLSPVVEFVEVVLYARAAQDRADEHTDQGGDETRPRVYLLVHFLFQDQPFVTLDAVLFDLFVPTQRDEQADDGEDKAEDERDEEARVWT